MVAVLVCTMYYTSLKCKTSWGVRKNSSCMVLATALCIHSREKKQTAPFPRGSQCALWGEASGHRAGQLETTNTEASQKRANCKPPSRAGMCYQQWAGFFSAWRWQRQGKLPKNPEGCFGVNSTEKKLKVMGLVGKDAERDHCTIT